MLAIFYNSLKNELSNHKEVMDKSYMYIAKL